MSTQAWIVRVLWIATTVGALAVVVLVASLMAAVDGGPGMTVIFIAFCGLVVGLRAILAPVTEESTLAVAASPLVAFALFQPSRHRVQRAVHRRFDRARYYGERTTAAFAERLRDQVDLARVKPDPGVTVEPGLSPDTSVPWIRRRATAR